MKCADCPHWKDECCTKELREMEDPICLARCHDFLLSEVIERLDILIDDDLEDEGEEWKYGQC